MGIELGNPYFEPESSTRLNKIDPYHPPGISVHFRRTIIWEILPEVTFFTLVAAGQSDSSCPVRVSFDQT